MSLTVLLTICGGARVAGAEQVGGGSRGAPRTKREFGLGVGTTVGALWGGTRTMELTAPIFGLLDVNLIVPVARSVELQVWTPLSFALFENAIGVSYFQLAVLARVHPRGSGFYLAPGLDVMALKERSRDNRSWTLTVPLTIGYETPWPDGRFGFSIALRPLVGLLIDRSTPTTHLGPAYGFLLEMDVMGYLVAAPRQPDAKPPDPRSPAPTKTANPWVPF